LRETPKLFTPASQQFAAWGHDYIDAGIGVFPSAARSKAPMLPGEGGAHRATLDHEMVEAWAWMYPGAAVAVVPPPRKAIFDIDVSRGKQGREQFIRLVGVAPEDVSTPTATSPSGGLHLWFDINDEVLSNRRGVNGAPHIDIKVHPAGYVLAPMGYANRVWLNGKPRKPMPAPPQLIAAACCGVPRRDHFGARAPAVTPEPVQYCGIDSRYGRATLDRVAWDIARAQDGAQESAFSAGALKIARLIASGDLAPDAIEAVRAVAYSMPSYDPRRPWTKAEIDRKIERQLERGRANPWTVVDWTRKLGR
jgi:hypothetical protein